MGPWESTPSTSIIDHPVSCTGRDCACFHGRTPHPRASSSTLCAEQAGIANGSVGEHPIHKHPRAACALHRQGSLMGSWESTPCTSIREHPVHCAGKDRSWVHGRAPHPRAYTIILGAETLGNAHGPMREHPIHKHPRAACALHRQGSPMGPWESTPCTSIPEHPVHCTGKDRSWVHGRAPHPRASTSTLRAARAGIAHGLMGEHPMREQPRASCALRRQGSLMGPC